MLGAGGGRQVPRRGEAPLYLVVFLCKTSTNHVCRGDGASCVLGVLSSAAITKSFLSGPAGLSKYSRSQQRRLPPPLMMLVARHRHQEEGKKKFSACVTPGRFSKGGEPTLPVAITGECGHHWGNGQVGRSDSSSSSIRYFYLIYLLLRIDRKCRLGRPILHTGQC